MTLTLEQAQAKALAYGTGQVPIRHLPPTTPHVTKSGICDYCNKQRPVVRSTPNKLFEICWTCQCSLLDTLGEKWHEKANSTLERNKQNRAQALALKTNQKKGVSDVRLG